MKYLQRLQKAKEYLIKNFILIKSIHYYIWDVLFGRLGSYDKIIYKDKFNLS